MFFKLSLPKRLLACAAAGGIGLMSMANAGAGNCGCEASCSACPPVNCCQCTCKCSPWPKHNCLSKAMDKVASGFEKLFGCGSCCEDACCDDACDAAMIEELMMPAPPSNLHHHHHSVPSVSPVAPMPKAYHGPTRDMRITPTGPSQWHDAGQPTIDPPSQGQHLGAPGALPEPTDRVPPPVRMPEPEPRQTEPDNGGSLFDTLSDPFKDDDEAAVRMHRSVRPSSYLQPITVNSRNVKPLSRSTYTSSRRTARRSQ